MSLIKTIICDISLDTHSSAMFRIAKSHFVWNAHAPIFKYKFGQAKGESGTNKLLVQQTMGKFASITCVA